MPEQRANKSEKSELGERAWTCLAMENEGPEDRRQWWISSAALLAESDGQEVES